MRSNRAAITLRLESLRREICSFGPTLIDKCTDYTAPAHIKENYEFIGLRWNRHSKKRVDKRLSKIYRCLEALRLIPSAALRDDKVVGRKPSNSGAPSFA